MASHDYSSEAIRVADAARAEGILEGTAAGRVEGRRNGRTSAYLAAAAIVDRELLKAVPDWPAVAATMKRCAAW